MRYITQATTAITQVTGVAAFSKSYALGLARNSTPNYLNWRITQGAGNAGAEVSGSLYFALERIDIGETPVWRVFNSIVGAQTTASSMSFLPGQSVLYSVMCSSASASAGEWPQYSYRFEQLGET